MSVSVCVYGLHACSNNESLAGEGGDSGGPNINDEVEATTEPTNQAAATPGATLHLQGDNGKPVVVFFYSTCEQQLHVWSVQLTAIYIYSLVQFFQCMFMLSAHALACTIMSICM